MGRAVNAEAARRALLIGAAAWLSGCALDADTDHAGADAPASAAFAHPPRTAWVLSSGGPRCFVHVGVIKALDELGLVPDVIVGASAGALVGALRAAGMAGRAIEKLALELRPWTLARAAWGNGGERLSGNAIAALVRQHTGERLLERLRIPMVCVAQRLADGATVGFNRGDVGLAVQAAVAIEGQFTPVRIRGQRYADADLRTPLPVRMARALGATRVLAVDASAHEESAPAGTERWRAGDLRKRALTEPDARLADVLLHPQFGYYASMTREYRERLIDTGYRDTLAQAPALRALHAG